MAVKTNTTQSINRTSTVLGVKCEETQKNLKKLCKIAGCADDVKIETITIPQIPGSSDDVIYAGLNGADFYFLRGTTVKMPEPVRKLLQNTKHL